MGFHPGTGLVYLPTMELRAPCDDRPFDLAHWMHSPNGEASMGVAFPNTDAPLDAGHSALVAWDPVRQHPVWKVATPGTWNGGVLSTAGGLVFQGQMDGYLRAYAAGTGTELWSFAA